MKNIFFYAYGESKNDAKEQFEKMEKWSNQNGYNVTGLYCDFMCIRDDLWILLDRVKSGDCDKVLVINKDRLGSVFCRLLKKYGCDIKEVEEIC